MMNKQLNVVRTMVACSETPSHELKGGAKISHTQANYTLSGDLEGVSSVDYALTHLANGLVYFVGYEMIEGCLDGKDGTFTLHHEGTYNKESDVVRVDVNVVAGSGIAALSNIAGKGQIESATRYPEKSHMTIGLAFKK